MMVWWQIILLVSMGAQVPLIIMNYELLEVQDEARNYLELCIDLLPNHYGMYVTLFTLNLFWAIMGCLVCVMGPIFYFA